MANLSVPPGGDGSAIGFTSDDHSFYLRHDDEWWTIDVVDDRAPHVALSLHDLFVNGQSRKVCPRIGRPLHAPYAQSDRYAGYADRVVLGKWAGEGDGYIGEARHNGGIYYDTGSKAWSATGHNLSKPELTRKAGRSMRSSSRAAQTA